MNSRTTVLAYTGIFASTEIRHLRELGKRNRRLEQSSFACVITEHVRNNNKNETVNEKYGIRCSNSCRFDIRVLCVCAIRVRFREETSLRRYPCMTIVIYGR